MSKSLVALEENKSVIKLEEKHDLKIGDVIRIYGEEKYEVLIEDVQNKKSIVVSGLPQNLESVFVFGKKVEDFHVVDYDRIFTTGISAIQELHKEIEDLKAQNQLLKVSNELLKEKNSNMVSEIELIKSHLGMDKLSKK